MELTFKTVGMSYWDFDVTGRKFTAFNDPVNDYHPETPIDVDQYLSAATRTTGNLYANISRE